MTETTIHPKTTLGHVHLTVSDLSRALDFYQQALGFKVRRREGGMAYLGAGQADLLVLTENRQSRQVAGTTGLFHFAILVPSRLELAQSLRRLAETRAPLEGFADHLVSEAIYLADPDGNGIEIYRDRPREQWQFEANGRLKMATDPLDVTDLLAELAGQSGTWTGLSPDTVLGHVHLRVANIAQTEAFYSRVIGFELMTRYGPAASFLSAGGYHHHLGLNTWASLNAPPPPADAVGLRWYTIHLPNREALNQVTARIQQAGVEMERREEGIFLRDPAQNGLVLAGVEGQNSSAIA